jgi:hypothetical protein
MTRSRVERLLEALFCPGCLCLRFGPGHLARRYVFGIDCRHAG